MDKLDGRIVDSSNKDSLIAGGISYWTFTKNKPPLNILKGNVKDQALIFKKNGVDLLILEMMEDIKRMMVTLEGAKNVNLPIWVGLSCKKDSSGKLITSKLNEQILEEISRAGGGSFLRFNNQPANFKNIIKEVDVMEKRLIQSHMYSQYEDQFQKFGSLSLCLFIASIFIYYK